MSYVTNVMLQFDGCSFREDGGAPEGLEGDSANRGKIDEITARLASGQVFRLITREGRASNWGGGKNAECDLLAAAFNYLPLEDFIKELESLTWSSPEMFRLFVQRQGSDAFGVWVIKDGKIVCVVEESGW